MLDTLPLPSTGFCRCNRRAHLFHLFTCFTFSPVHLFHLAVGFPCVSVIVYLSIQVESLQAEKSGKSMAIKAHTHTAHNPLWNCLGSGIGNLLSQCSVEIANWIRNWTFAFGKRWRGSVFVGNLRVSSIRHASALRMINGLFSGKSLANYCICKQSL